MIQVTIVNDSRREECEAACGIDWSSTEATDLAIQRLKERFGDNVELTYLDLAEAKADQDTLHWEELIKDKSLLLPLLLVKGQLRISGQFDFRQLLDTVEAEVELGGS